MTIYCSSATATRTEMFAMWMLGRKAVSFGTDTQSANAQHMQPAVIFVLLNMVTSYLCWAKIKSCTLLTHMLALSRVQTSSASTSSNITLSTSSLAYFSTRICSLFILAGVYTHLISRTVRESIITVDATNDLLNPPMTNLCFKV